MVGALCLSCVYGDFAGYPLCSSTGNPNGTEDKHKAPTPHNSTPCPYKHYIVSAAP